MGYFDLDDRLTWQQAAFLLGVKKSAFFRLVRAGKIPAHGVASRGRFYLKSECQKYLAATKR